MCAPLIARTFALQVEATEGMKTCESSVGNEGGWLSKAYLRGGGTIVKVLRHTKIVDELHRLDRAWWAPYVRAR